MNYEQYEPEPADVESDSLPAASEEQLNELVELLRSDPQALAHVVSQMCPDDVRKDGWTPFNRRLFLQVLSESGRVSLGCEYTRLTRQSAYALRARDPCSPPAGTRRASLPAHTLTVIPA